MLRALLVWGVWWGGGVGVVVWLSVRWGVCGVGGCVVGCVGVRVWVGVFVCE